MKQQKICIMYLFLGIFTKTLYRFEYLLRLFIHLQNLFSTWWQDKKILWYPNAMMEKCVYSILKKTNKTQIKYHSYSLIFDVHTYIILKNLVGHTPSKKYRKTNLYQKQNESLVYYSLRCRKSKNIFLDISRSYDLMVRKSILVHFRPMK